MSRLRRVVTLLLAYFSWGLALYLFYAGSVAAGVGALVSAFVFAAGMSAGTTFIERFGPDIIKKAREEGRVEGRREKA